ncbi:MAG: 30S ribosomal protein S16 [Saprospiraceae bacterium]|nr:30S ribosomal protein S16 [Saprospiraceae bacterium]
MAVKIRLARRGRKKQPFYHIVIADARAPRDGRFIEKIGSYNPMTKPATIEIDRDKAYEWLRNGAQPTDTVRAILRFKGVMYKKHLMRGVEKGALTIEEANAKLDAWIADKEAKIKARKEQVAEERRAFHAMVSGAVPAVKPKAAEVVEENAPSREAPKTLAEEIEAKEKAAQEDAGEETTADQPAAAAEEAAAIAEETAEAVATKTTEETPAAEEAAEAPAVEEATEESAAEEAAPEEE